MADAASAAASSTSPMSMMSQCKSSAKDAAMYIKLSPTPSAPAARPTISTWSPANSRKETPMFHNKRRWCLSEVDSAEQFGDMLSQRTCTLCSAFCVRGHEEYLFLNDATHEDAAAE